MATFGGFRVAALVYHVRSMGSLGFAVIRRMTLRVHVFLDFAYCLILNFGSAFDPSREMAMARASLTRSSLAWLHVLQHVYRMMAPAGVVIPSPSGGMPGRHVHVCLLSPGGQRAEHEVARSWTERSRPRGHRPSGRVLVLTSRDVWAPTRELAL